MTENSGEGTKWTEPHSGVVTHINGLGYFIQPDDRDNAVVGFNKIDPDKLPESFKIGDKVTFFLDEESQGANASKWERVEDKKE